MTTHDISTKQLHSRLEANGFKRVGAFGYWQKEAWSISIWNCGGSNREKLAYMLNEYSRVVARDEQRCKGAVRG